MAADVATKMILDVETEISKEFSTMMANDAMISLEMVPQDVEILGMGDLETVFGENVCQVIGSKINWQEEIVQEFIITEDDANGLIAKINEINDAIDSIDVLLENWNLAAQNNLSANLDPAPHISAPELESRAISSDDTLEDALQITYSLRIDDAEFRMIKVVESSWQTMIEASQLEVTTVDDLGGGSEFGDMGVNDDVEVETSVFNELGSSKVPQTTDGADISMLYDLKLDVVVELGRTQKPVHDILNLGRGAIVELDKLAGDPVEIYVNNKKLALGEVVVVDDHFGVRITQLVKRNERVMSLGET